MVDAVLASGNIGSVGKYDVEFKDGFLVLEADASYAIGSTGIVQKIGAGAVLDALAKAIPGVWDDAAIALVKKALGV